MSRDRAALLWALYRALVVMTAKRFITEGEADRAAAYLMDQGYDHCPVCLANRRREAFG